jgi:hypothetical protein
VRKRVPRAVNGAEIIDGGDPLHGFNVVKLVEARVHADAGVVDQSIDAPEFIERRVDQLTALLAVGYVSGNSDNSGAERAACVCSVSEQSRIARSENQTGSLSREELRDLETDAG